MYIANKNRKYSREKEKLIECLIGREIKKWKYDQSNSAQKGKKKERERET